MNLSIVDSIGSSPASINSLPSEIKTLIVRLAKLQDNNYWARYNSVNQHVNELFKNDLAENEWKGNSLNALFLVNKDWSDLAAVELFKIVETINMDSLIFKFRVILNRAHLVKTIQFSSTANSQDALMLLPSFINLKSIIFDSSVIQHLFFPSMDTLSDDNKLALVALSRRRVSSLSFEGCSAKEIITVLQACDRLIEVEILSRLEGALEELNLVGEILSKYSLERFSLDVNAALPESWSKLTWNSSSSMRYIRLTPDIFGSSSLDFLSIFSNSLNRLGISFSDFNLSDEEESPIFDKLQHLKLNLLLMESSDILKFFKNSPLVSLQLEFTDYNSPKADDPDIHNITQLVNQIPGLREIGISTRFIDKNQFSALINHCKLQNTNLSFTQWTDSIFNHVDDPPTIKDQFNHYKPILKNALVDGQTKLDEIINQDDVEGMEEMYNNCKWLRANSGVIRD